MDNTKTVAFANEAAYCSFYAVDPDLGFVVVSALTTAQEIGLRVAARLIGGQEMLLGNGVALQRQQEIEIPLPAPADSPQQGKAETPVTRYKVAYARTHPLRLETGVGYETCVLHRDATMQAAFGHWGYLLRMPGSSDAQFWARFFHLWGNVTGLPARPAWARSLWGIGTKMELITPLQAFGCEGWRIDPRLDRPGELSGWRDALRTITLAEKEIGNV